MDKTEPTISDIAQLAGVGKATVSRVLNQSGYVKAETRKRIDEAINELKYVPSATARSLSRRESDAVGLVIPEIENPFFSEIITGIMDAVEKNGLVLILSSTRNDVRLDAKALNTMRRQRLKGLIYTPAAAYDDREQNGLIVKLLTQVASPVVLLDRMMGDEAFDGVRTDDFAGAYECVKALIEAGHRRIGVISGDMKLPIGVSRFEGARQACADYGIELCDKDVIKGDFETVKSYEATKIRFGEGDIPPCFFASNNLSAMGFLRAAADFGIKVPGDIGFICFDRMDSLETFGVRLSCLNRNLRFMGSEAVRLLLERIHSPKKPTERVVIKPELVLTGSERLKET